jgi:predicted molibdopterin-dependent oxidoreductase YjgC
VSATAGQWRRLAEHDRPTIVVTIDGIAASALRGDTIMTAILLSRGHIRVSEFGDGARAGLCAMGACQDCWVALASGERLRACTTLAEDGMSIVTTPHRAVA